jgi:hypothetical protein
MNQRCETCGAALTPEDYRVPSCRFCGSAHKHHRDAAEKVLQVQAVMQNMMGGMGGMPFGAPPPVGPAPPFVVVPGMVVQQHVIAPGQANAYHLVPPHMSPPMHMGYPQPKPGSPALWIGIAAGVLIMFMFGLGFAIAMAR